MKKFAVLTLSALITLPALAQNTDPGQPMTRQEKRDARNARIDELIRQEEEGEIIFNKQSVFGLKLATDGYGLSYELSRFKSNRLSMVYQFEINEKKHPKEKKVSFNDLNGSTISLNSIIFGKVNNFYQVKLGVGQQRIIGGKGNKNGVAISVVYAGGISVGLVKPYYVNVLADGQEVMKQYPEIIDSGYAFSGAAGFFKGWSDMTVNPGAHVKAAMRFDYGRFNETVTAIEVGLNAEFYSKKVLQMAYNPEKQFFFNAYVSLLLGKRK